MFAKNSPASVWLKLFLVSIFLATSLAPPTLAVPPYVSFQGRLTNALGEPLTGTNTVTVKIYGAEVGGTLVYQQVFPGITLAESDNGIFNVTLGPEGTGAGGVAVNLKDIDLSADDYFVEIQVGDTTIPTAGALRPRLASSPSALVARHLRGGTVKATSRAAAQGAVEGLNTSSGTTAGTIPMKGIGVLGTGDPGVKGVSRTDSNTFGMLGYDPVVEPDSRAQMRPGGMLELAPDVELVAPTPTPVMMEDRIIDPGALWSSKKYYGAYGQTARNNYGVLGYKLTSGGETTLQAGVAGFATGGNIVIYGKQTGTGDLLHLKLDNTTKFRVDKDGWLVTDARAQIGTGAPDPGGDGLGVKGPLVTDARAKIGTGAPDPGGDGLGVKGPLVTDARAKIGTGAPDPGADGLGVAGKVMIGSADDPGPRGLGVEGDVQIDGGITIADTGVYFKVKVGTAIVRSVGREGKLTVIPSLGANKVYFASGTYRYSRWTPDAAWKVIDSSDLSIAPDGSVVVNVALPDGFSMIMGDSMLYRVMAFYEK